MHTMIKSEYVKWKDIAKTGESAQLQNKTVELKPKPRSKVTKSFSSKNPLPKEPHFSRNSKNHTFDDVKHLEKQREHVRGIEARVLASQRDDIQAFLNGYLSPQKMNKMLHTGTHFGNTKPLQNDSADYDDEEEEILAELRRKRKQEMTKSKQPNQSNVENDTPQYLNNEARSEGEVDEEKEETQILDMDDMEKIHGILEKYDAVKLRKNELSMAPQEPSENTREAKDVVQDAEPRRAQIGKNLKLAVPTAKQVTTKTDAYKLRREIDKNYVTAAVKYTPGLPKIDRLKELEQQLQENLKGCPNAFTRLQVYATIFDTVISEFPMYGPLLAQIKSEYDALIAEFWNDQHELDFLRTKVMKLVSVNENRLLLKYERQKCRELEKELERVQKINEELRDELHRKISVYASYLPPNVYIKTRMIDPTLPDQQPVYEIGEDPISLYEKEIATLRDDISARDSTVAALKAEREKNYVPKEDKEMVVEQLHDTQFKLNKLNDRNQQLEADLAAKSEQLTKLEQLLREKEEAYTFLITEYNELSEAVAVNFDQKVLAGTDNDMNLALEGIDLNALNLGEITDINALVAAVSQSGNESATTTEQ